MSTGPINDWASGLADVGPVYPLPGAEGLWVGVTLIFLVWWIMACLRTDQLNQAQAEDEFGDPEQMRDLLDALEGEDGDAQ